jgi:hypothetical protein
MSEGAGEVKGLKGWDVVDSVAKKLLGLKTTEAKEKKKEKKKEKRVASAAAKKEEAKKDTPPARFEEIEEVKTEEPWQEVKRPTKKKKKMAATQWPAQPDADWTRERIAEGGPPYPSWVLKDVRWCEATASHLVSRPAVKVEKPANSPGYSGFYGYCSNCDQKGHPSFKCPLLAAKADKGDRGGKRGAEGRAEGPCLCTPTCAPAGSDTPHGSHGFNCEKLYRERGAPRLNRWQGALKKGKCHECGKFGHEVAQCPDRAARRAKRARSGSPAGGPEGAAREGAQRAAAATASSDAAAAAAGAAQRATTSAAAGSAPGVAAPPVP